MKEHNGSAGKLKIPRVGHRILKSAFSVLLCYLIYLLRGQEGIVFYSMLAALWCIRPYFGNTMEMAAQRISGTLIGSVFGLVVLLIKLYLLPMDLLPYELIYFLLVGMAIIPIIQTTLILHHRDASYFSCVVFLSIVVNHVGDENPYIFVWNRVLDTLIGVIVGIGVNSFHLPTRKRKDILFVSGVDDTLVAEDEALSDFSKRQINYLIDIGANFTVSTRRAPAAVQEILSGVRLKLPIIAMDGAVLYDMNTNTYIREFVISHDTADQVRELAQEQGLNCFSNVIIDDCLLICYKELNNSAQQSMYEKLCRSPYRNYIRMTPPEDTRTVYLMFLDTTEKMQRFYEILSENGYDQFLKILFYPSKDYAGFSYIKIYNRNAGRERMLCYLKEMTGLTQTVTFGSEEGKYDVTVKNDDTSQVATTLRQMYEQLLWRK